ncbi:serine phosphatase RsbU (regulator of sigma subunit) [Lipingzhangella halophila]|uniref:Serine phosphatase RsbU (Regulator of sigma subunit) n=1 Tax=Lipingzhangella halophila TaxID=1783352 RepID=A0A7W7W1U6_9ACTN|nr:fused response regulator/phosphatase [Lipingzhangella halophila]MBB4930030.1 serine phosphatase RsbU (regulator of sigma subunit) [Lipingzhangella halophila]
MTAKGPDNAGTGRADRANGTTAPRELAEILLIEDDAQDAFLVEELLADTPLDPHITWVATLGDAREYLAGFRGCVLLDLNLPDASGIALLREVLATVESAAVVVLTGLHDEHEGIAAVAAGAQDYLVKGQVDGSLLARSLRYSVERQRADENARQLREAEIHARENMRLERGLLPQVLLDGTPLSHRSFYRPGRKRALVGGDFFDAVQKAGTTHVIIGDVSGHGPDEAALGVSLRIAWRALVMGGVVEENLLPALEEILVSERAQDEMYATLCQASIDVDREQARIRLFGHPPPLLVSGGEVKEIPAVPRPPLGVLPDDAIDVESVAFPRGSTLLFYTDGLVDAFDGGPPDRLEVQGLRRILTEVLDSGCVLTDLPGQVVDEAERRNGGPLQDDVAMLLVTHGEPM